MEKNYITPLGLEKLVKEYEQLHQVERPAVVKVVTWAAGNGDRSENADYQYGKRRLREIDKRLRFLQQRINCAIVVDPHEVIKQRSDRIQFGATVSFSDETGKVSVVTIVGVDEVDLDRGHISWRSPLGGALLGKDRHEDVSYRTPQGIREIEILDFYYQVPR